MFWKRNQNLDFLVLNFKWEPDPPQEYLSLSIFHSLFCKDDIYTLWFKLTLCLLPIQPEIYYMQFQSGHFSQPETHFRLLPPNHSENYEKIGSEANLYLSVHNYPDTSMVAYLMN